MRTLSLTIDAATDSRTVKSLLLHELQMSSSHISRIKLRETGICVDGVRVYTDHTVRAGQTLTAETGDSPVRRAQPVRSPLTVLWEDADVVIIDKPAGMTVHESTRDPQGCTVENALSAYLPPDDGIHPVSRLDRGTTGIMTVAKNGYMHELLRRTLHTGNYRRSYLAVAVGTVTPESGRIELPIGMAEGSVYKHAIRDDGKPCVTDYATLRTDGAYTLLHLIPQTGRTHQLRVHMAALGYPLAGDWLYGTQSADIARPALHSHELDFTHPLTGERICIVCPPPGDMARLI